MFTFLKGCGETRHSESNPSQPVILRTIRNWQPQNLRPTGESQTNISISISISHQPVKRPFLYLYYDEIVQLLNDFYSLLPCNWTLMSTELQLVCRIKQNALIITNIEKCIFFWWQILNSVMNLFALNFWGLLAKSIIIWHVCVKWSKVTCNDFAL